MGSLRRGLAAGAIAAPIALLACSSFSEGGAPATTPDADVPETAPAPEGDAAAPSDAGADSACAASHPGATICDDFDNGGYQPTWKLDTDDAGVAFSIVSSPHFSAPYALAARSLTSAPDGGAHALLRGTASTGGKTTFTFEAQVQLLATSPSVATTAPVVMAVSLGPKAFLLFQIRTAGGVAACTTSGAELGELGTGDVPFAAGQWHHVKLRASLADAGNVVDLACDVDGVTRTGSQTDLVEANATATIGLQTTPGQSAMNVLFDDVVYTAE